MDTGATQGMSALRMGADEDSEAGHLEAIEVDDDNIARTGASAAAAGPSSAPGHLAPGLTVSLRDELMVDFVEEEVMVHLPWVAAANAGQAATGSPAVFYPTCWADLQGILQKLGYGVTAEEAWHLLGLAMLDGPDPSELMIANRRRTAEQLCELAVAPPWADGDLALARGFAAKVNDAAATCVSALPVALAQRRRLKVTGRQVALWAPTDQNALTRFLSQFMRRTAAAERPAALYLLAPVPLQAGMGTLETVLDLWHSPLLSGKWPPIVRAYTLTLTPMEMLLPGGGFPRHVYQGLAVFHLGHTEPRGLPRLLEPHAAICTVEAPRVMVLDLRADEYNRTMNLLTNSVLQGVLSRAPRRSPLSTTAIPRLCLDWILPPTVQDMDIFLVLRHGRGESLASDTFYGLRSMVGHGEALLLEFSSKLAVPHYWPLCSQLVAISPSRVVVYTEAEPETWTGKMDYVMHNDVEETSVRLRWRASKHGGRVVAAPSATSRGLAASRRRGTAPLSLHDFQTDVVIQGEVGKEDGQVGEYIHLATQDPAAQPGRLRVLLSSIDDVRKLHNALHAEPGLSTHRFHDPAGYSGHLHGGIQYWDADGSTGFLIEVVWFLRAVPTASSSQLRHEMEAMLDTRCLPVLPPLAYSAEDILPRDPDALLRLDMPIALYRRQRLLRALGSLPRPGQFQGEFSAATWNAQAFFCSDEGRFRAKVAYASRLLERACILMITEAHGTDGALDIVVTYFHTGSTVTELDKVGVHPNFMEYCSTFPRLREHMRTRLARAIQPQHRVLTLLGGDFNWAALKTDRRCVATLQPTGGRDDGEERNFRLSIGQRHGLEELFQPEMTHVCATELLVAHPGASRLEQLPLLKEAMRGVAENFGAPTVGLPLAEKAEDKLGAVMGFIRASELGFLTDISHCLLRYPHISSFVANPYDLQGNLTTSLRALRDHAVELAREAALGLLLEAQDDAAEGDALQVKRKRQRGTRLLYKLAPGRSSGIGAIVDERGN
ncbi:unnamed protein product, partial [Prorocentrum cordatum]